MSRQGSRIVPVNRDGWFLDCGGKTPLWLHGGQFKGNGKARRVGKAESCLRSPYRQIAGSWVGSTESSREYEWSVRGAVTGLLWSPEQNGAKTRTGSSEPRPVELDSFSPREKAGMRGKESHLLQPLSHRIVTIEVEHCLLRFSVLDEAGCHCFTPRLQHEHDAANNRNPRLPRTGVFPRREASPPRLHPTVTTWFAARTTN